MGLAGHKEKKEHVVGSTCRPAVGFTGHYGERITKSQTEGEVTRQTKGDGSCHQLATGITHQLKGQGSAHQPATGVYTPKIGESSLPSPTAAEKLIHQAKEVGSLLQKTTGFRSYIVRFPSRPQAI